MLASNGFRVIRYDATNHTGESDGGILDCTLSSLKEDLEAAIDYSAVTFPSVSLGVVLTSLSAVVGFHVASKDARIRFVGGIVPVVNLRHTLKEVYQQDLIGEHQANHRWGVLDLLGFPVDADRFISDALENGWEDLEATKRAVAGIRAPVSFVVGANDPWVDCNEVSSVVAALNGHARQLVEVQSSMHQLHENATASKAVLRDITRAAALHLSNVSLEEEGVKYPRLREVALQARLERERRRLVSNHGREEEAGFWGDYLHAFQSIIRVPDFRQFFETISELLGDPADQDVVLDAGCGNGTFGMFLLSQLLEKSKTGKAIPAFGYVGVDFVPAALKEAQRVHRDFLSAIRAANQNKPGDPSTVPGTFYVWADLDEKLPFIDNYAQKICCNLVLSYVRHPHLALKELYRVLAPGGTLVVTSLKPFADLSLIYRRFLQMAETEQDIAEARKLLSNAGLIRAREAEGHFKFFSQTELIGMAHELGVRDAKAMLTFSDQASVVAIRKPA
jgi:ubiquinone/menaquinone biosynthesis C-methylase UbiE